MRSAQKKKKTKEKLPALHLLEENSEKEEILENVVSTVFLEGALKKKKS